MEIWIATSNSGKLSEYKNLFKPHGIEVKSPLDLNVFTFPPENGDTFDEKKKAASDFITEKEYPFTVLMDAKDKVITSYKVDGIPTKFIIDKDNKIRFKSVGYAGSSDKLVKELKMMIEMADRDSTTTASLRD